MFYNNELFISKVNNLNQLEGSIKQSNLSKFINQLSERIKHMESIFVVDRFEGKYAICENRNTGEVVDIELSQLPEGIQEGTVLKFEQGKYIIDATAQKEIEQRITEKMNNLWND